MHTYITGKQGLLVSESAVCFSSRVLINLSEQVPPDILDFNRSVRIFFRASKMFDDDVDAVDS